MEWQTEGASLRFDDTDSTLTRKNIRVAHSDTRRGPSFLSRTRLLTSAVRPFDNAGTAQVSRTGPSMCTHQAGEFQSNEIARNYVQARALKRLTIRFKGIWRPVRVALMRARIHIYVQTYIRAFVCARACNYARMRERSVGVFKFN